MTQGSSFGNSANGQQPLPPGGQLAAWSLANQGHLSTAMRLIAAGGRSNDSCLHARQSLEHAYGGTGGRPLTGTDYFEAARLLDDRREQGLAVVMESLASVDGELRAAVPGWHGRYAGRPLTRPERAAAEKIRAGEVIESKPAGPCADGAHYSLAYYPRSGKPAIVVTTSALSEEIVNFASTRDAAAWLAGRSAGTAGPLAVTAGGAPATRTAREEELLAYLVRHPADAARAADLVRPATFTTHLRAELFTAIRWAAAEGGTPGYGVIAGAYGRRLLRAPADAGPDIGWPDATRAMGYLHRLADTEVPAAQAVTAANQLAAADADAAAEAARAQRAAVPAPDRAVGRAPDRTAQAAQARAAGRAPVRAAGHAQARAAVPSREQPRPPQPSLQAPAFRPPAPRL